MMVYNPEVFIEEHATEIIKIINSTSLIDNSGPNQASEIINRYIFSLTLLSHIIPKKQEDITVYRIVASKIIDIITDKKYIRADKETFLDSLVLFEEKFVEEYNSHTSDDQIMFNISLFYLRWSGLNEPSITDIVSTSSKIVILINKIRCVFSNKLDDPYFHNEGFREKSNLVWLVLVPIIIVIIFNSCNH